MPRNSFFDQWRGLSVLLMMTYHFCFDLEARNYFEMKSYFWYLFPRVVVFLFYSLSGYLEGIFPHRNKNNNGKGLGKLFFSSGIVSAVSYFLYPSHWIYFGTLHCLLFSHLLVRFPRYAIIPAFFSYISSPYWGPLLISSWEQSLDHVEIIPWAGIFCAFFLLGRKWVFIPKFRIAPKWGGRGLEFLGRHALLIYLIHRPIQLGLLEAKHLYFP